MMNYHSDNDDWWLLKVGPAPNLRLPPTLFKVNEKAIWGCEWVIIPLVPTVGIFYSRPLS